ncbi:UNVERIFIED_CONTAM: hypothetical protein K2H54_048825 [Gekko kuhli]
MATESQVVLYRHRASVRRHPGPNPKLRICGRRSQRKTRLVWRDQAYTVVGPRAEGLDPKVGHRAQLKAVVEVEGEAPLDAVESVGPNGQAHGSGGRETSASNPDDPEMQSSVLHLLRSEGTEDGFDGFACLSGLRGFGRPAADVTEPSLNGGGGGELREGVDISGRKEDSKR